MRFIDICSTCQFILGLQQFCLTYSSQSGIGNLDIVRFIHFFKKGSEYFILYYVSFHRRKAPN